MADYTTFEQISVRLGGQVSPAQQEFIEQKITEASAAIDEWCGQEFTPSAAAATARIYEPANGYQVTVDPFWTTSGLVVETDDADTGTYVTWAADDYGLRRYGGNRAGRLNAPYDTLVAVGSYAFPTANKYPGALRVTAKWGWAATPIAVQGACEILTVELWARKDTPFGITQTVAEFGGLRIGRDLFAQVASMLRPFRREDIVLGIA
jgi:hypothetical protein